MAVVVYKLSDMEEELKFAESYARNVADFFIQHLPQILGAACILMVCWVIGRVLASWLTGICTKRHFDVTLTRFFGATVKLLMLGLGLVMSLNLIGVEVTPFIALLGAGAFGLSLAIQGPVSNYGAGIVIIITRPFTVGDSLSIHGHTGLVDEVSLGFTILKTEDGELVTIPNRKILGEILVNSHALKVVESTINVAYGTDVDEAIACVRKALESIEAIPDEPAAQVGVDEFGDFAMKIGYRYWVPTGTYFNVKFMANRAVILALENAGIKIPVIQRDVKVVE